MHAELCELSETDYSDPKPSIINCTLSAALRSRGLMEISIETLRTQPIGALIAYWAVEQADIHRVPSGRR